MLEVINLLFIPVISLHIWYRRHDKNMGRNFTTLCDYVFWVVADLIACAVTMIALKSLVGISAYPEAMPYSIVACFWAVVLPYVHEVFKKCFEVKVDISKRQDK